MTQEFLTCLLANTRQAHGHLSVSLLSSLAEALPFLADLLDNLMAGFHRLFLTLSKLFHRQQAQRSLTEMYHQHALLLMLPRPPAALPTKPKLLSTSRSPLPPVQLCSSHASLLSVPQTPDSLCLRLFVPARPARPSVPPLLSIRAPCSCLHATCAVGICSSALLLSRLFLLLDCELPERGTPPGLLVTAVRCIVVGAQQKND